MASFGCTEHLCREILLSVFSEAVDQAHQASVLHSRARSHGSRPGQSARSFADCLEVLGPDALRGRHTRQTASGQMVHIYQPRVHQQFEEGACGYYALTNAKQILLALSEPDEQRALAGFKKALTSATFWEDYFWTEQLLLRHAARQGPEAKYPWTSRDISCGVLERPHLDYVLAHDSRIRGSGLQISALSEMSGEHLNWLADIFARSSEAKHGSDSYCHAFIMGAVNHWNVIILNRVGAVFEIICADSRNNDITNIDMFQERAKAACHPQVTDEYIAYWYIESRRQSMQSLDMMVDCGSGSVHIRTHHLDTQTLALLHSFHKHVLAEGPVLEPPALSAFALALSPPLPAPRGDLAHAKFQLITPDPTLPFPNPDAKFVSFADPDSSTSSGSTTAGAGSMAGADAGADSSVPLGIGLVSGGRITASRLTEWLTDYYPPAMIKRDIRRMREVGLNYVSREAQAAMGHWLQGLCSSLTVRDSKVPVIAQLRGTLDQWILLFAEVDSLRLPPGRDPASMPASDCQLS